MLDFPEGKGTGRTHWMLDQLYGAILSGQPKSVVVGLNAGQATGLLERVRHELKILGAECKVKRSQNMIFVENCEIHFVTQEFIESDEGVATYPERIWGQFWDHYVDGIE